MLSVGLTGGIGAGKSEVSRLLAGFGAVVIDADKIAREVVEPGTKGLEAVVAEFGAEILGPDGRLDRPALGQIVFNDPLKREALNAIVHPLVGTRSAELQAAADEGAILVHDVPLLTENGLASLYDLVIVVDAAPRTQLDRLLSRGMSEEDARARMAVQASREQRRRVADIVIDNDGPLAALESQVRAVWERLRERA